MRDLQRYLHDFAVNQSLDIQYNKTVHNIASEAQGVIVEDASTNEKYRCRLKYAESLEKAREIV